MKNKNQQREKLGQEYFERYCVAEILGLVGVLFYTIFLCPIIGFLVHNSIGRISGCGESYGCFLLLGFLASTLCGAVILMVGLIVWMIIQVTKECADERACKDLGIEEEKNNDYYY